MRTNLCASLIFIALLLHHDVVALKLRARSARRGVELAQGNSTELQPVNGTAANGLVNNQSRHVAGRRTLTYLVQLQTWQRLSRVGVRCPKPQPCECHCDCPNTAIAPAPPSPTLCPVYLNAWPVTNPPPTAKPTTSGALTTTPAPRKQPEKCVEGYVQMSDGTCGKITYETIVMLKGMVDQQKAELDKMQLEFNAVAEVNCTSCPGERIYFELRPKLILKHQQYLAVLNMFLAALRIYDMKIKVKEDKKKAEAKAPDGPRGPEFVLGEKKLRAHCEPWTALNKSLGKPTKNFCAIICRQQPSCVGFGWDPKSDWCLWYDDVKPQSKDACSSQAETTYLKKWQGYIDEDLWIAMDKVHIFDGAIQKAVDIARMQAEVANDKFSRLWSLTKENEDNTKKKNITATKNNATDAVNFYGGTLWDTHQLRKQLEVLRATAYSMTRAEVNKRPPSIEKPPPPPAPVVDEVDEVVIPEGFEEPESDPPKILEWHDFPNSQDTAWSQQHPDCPMGTPCFCDCKCRGAPPQNFVEPPPPPYPPLPCPPPPPLPPPGMLSDLAVAQSLR